jgi:hypothetical protein
VKNKDYREQDQPHSQAHKPIPSAGVSDAESAHHHTEASKRWSSIEGMTTIFTGILASFAVFSFIALWIQVSDARKNFVQDQRPYIWLTKDGNGAPEFQQPTSTSLTGQVVWTYHYTNYGKTPPYRVRSQHYISISGSPFVDSYGASPEGSVGPPIPPTADLRGSVISMPGLTPERFNEAIGINGKGISIFVKFEYTDAFDKPYETGICLKTLNTGAISFCPDDKLNYVK